MVDVIHDCFILSQMLFTNTCIIHAKASNSPSLNPEPQPSTPPPPPHDPPGAIEIKRL